MKKANRRTFLKKIGTGGAAALLPISMPAATAVATPSTKPSHKKSKAGRNYNDAYEGEHLKRVAFPIGGLGAGMFCLEGTGAISHMSVRNRPDVFHEPAMFGAIAVKNVKNGSKVLEGPVPEWKRFGQPDTGNGSGSSTFGLPRFDKASCLTRFPFSTVTLSEESFPLAVEIKGWSPFIPTDADNSSIPVGAFEYKFKNNSAQSAECVFSYHSKNFMKAKRHETDKSGKDFIQPIAGGFVLSQTAKDKVAHEFGDFAIFTNDPTVVVDHCWFRGGWFDPLTMRGRRSKKLRPRRLIQLIPVHQGHRCTYHSILHQDRRKRLGS
jgi:hypothetical protein